MNEPGQRPIDNLAQAVRDAGGVVLVAKAIGTSTTHLSNVISGIRPLGRETAGRLRPVLPGVPAEVWVELLAPAAPDAAAEASA